MDWKTFMTSFLISAMPYIVALVIAFFTVMFLKYLVNNKKDITIIEMSLQLIKKALQDKLGDKASAVLDVWISGLEKIKDGEFTTEEAIAEFLEVVKSATGLKFTHEEHEVLKEQATNTLKLYGFKPKQTRLTIMSVMSNNNKRMP